MDKKIFLDVNSKISYMSVHANGKPTFNKEATMLMDLYNKSYFKVAKGKGSNCIYLFPVDNTKDTLRLSKIGSYYCFNNISIFRRLGFLRNNKYVVTIAYYHGEKIFKISL